MPDKKRIFAIVGSASENSANEKLLNIIVQLLSPGVEVEIFKDLKALPHFNPEQSATAPPELISVFREKIERADGVIISTPEYIFSIPSGLKNAIEWCVATTIFFEKPVGIITASLQGQKGHEELQLIMETLMAKLTVETTLLIEGIKGKITAENTITDAETEERLKIFIAAFSQVIGGKSED